MNSVSLCVKIGMLCMFMYYGCLFNVTNILCMCIFYFVLCMCVFMDKLCFACMCIVYVLFERLCGYVCFMFILCSLYMHCVMFM